MRAITGLERIRAEESPRWGAKAAVLGELLQQGFPVPPGVVLEASSEPVTPEELQELTTRAEGLGDGALAVRSSSVNEDLADSSAAGRYTTVLHVRGADALRDAVRRCLASGPDAPMAVLVQQQVPAIAAGVAFSADPITGDVDAALINAVVGLGDRLVSGEVTPDEWTVTGDSATALGVDDVTAISAEQALAVAGLARRVAADRGAPQDIEWAIDDRGVLVLLQARPITTMVVPVPIPIRQPAGYWMPENLHWATPPTPLSMSVLDMNPRFERMCEAYGLLASLRVEMIGGWPYVAVLPAGFDPFAGKQLPPAVPQWLLPALVRVVPPLRRRWKAARRALRDDLAGTVAERWRTEYQPAQQERLRELRDVDLSVLSDRELAEHLRATVRFLHDSLTIHYPVVMANFMGMAELITTCRELLDWPVEKTMLLLSGTSTATSDPTRALARIGAGETAGEGLVQELVDYQQTYGLRSLSLDLADRTIAEMPGLLERQLQGSRAFDPAIEEASLAAQQAAVEHEARSRLSEQQLGRFERALERGRRAYPLRDENALYTLDAPLAHVRYAALEAAARLVATEVLGHVDDVFYCTLDEVLDAVETPDGTRTAGLRERVRRRRGERLWALAHPGPPSYGEAPPPPSLGGMPMALRAPLQALMIAMENVVQPDLSARSAEDQRSGRLSGVAASPGVYTGPARIVRLESEFDRVRPGDVLVCPSTRPSWVVLFPSIGAVVTDIGGALAHPAIIAREHRIPAVVGTGSATEMLHDGQLVTVDGSRGLVSYAVESEALGEPSTLTEAV